MNATLFDIPVKSKHEQEFDKFHAENPKVYELFCEYVGKLKDAGYEHYSADAIIHYIRFQESLRTNSKDFKINNNFVAFYARKYMSEHLQDDGFFRTRGKQGE